MIVLIIAIVLLTIALLATIFGSLIYFGIFDQVQVSTGPSPYKFDGQPIVYRIENGSYADSSCVFTEILSILPKFITFATYTNEPNDNGDQTETQHLAGEAANKSVNLDISSAKYRYLVGAILSNEDVLSLSDDQREMLKKKGYSFGQLPSDVDTVVHSSFPYRGVVSVAVASRRVYPNITQYLKVSLMTL